MNMSPPEIWLIIALLGIGTFLVRFSFLGIIGDRKLPEWVLRHLRYTPVAILPGMIAPLVLWPEATDGAFDAPRVLAAFATLAVGCITKSATWAIIGGGTTLYAMLYLFG